ncbi:glycosyltransferase [Marinitoga litoralis]|uniref:glycosyltransferase n=1 Tax=Marinitoga litoralis TaxID=570855 RepID=UPI00196099F5|nr:glycosyltransferase [Marinitoga litoralis]MBM7558306.1 1,2-diacylglycerol 3-beta-glucosyltransferase [Marinitoga litoralis]
MEIFFLSVIFSIVFQLMGKYLNLYRTFIAKKNISEKKLKVSIIIPTYNEEEVIEESIKSILENTYSNFEIIVIDDNSKDRTYDIVKTLSQQNSKIKIFKKKGLKGKAQSINEAIEYVEGDVVLFLDADTLLTNNFLEEHIKYFSNEKVDMIYVDFESYNYKNEIIYDHQEIYFEFARNILYSNLFSKAVFMGNGVFIRKEILNKVLPLKGETVVDDVNLYIKLNQIGISQRFILEPKTKIQYTTNYKDLFFQHKRWYVGGLTELFEFFINGNYNLFGVIFLILFIIFFPIGIVVSSVFKGYYLLKYLFNFLIIIYGIVIGTMLLNRNIHWNKYLINSLITIPFLIIFEYIVLLYSFLSLGNKNNKWYKVKREKI